MLTSRLLPFAATFLLVACAVNSQPAPVVTKPPLATAPAAENLTASPPLQLIEFYAIN